MSLQIPAGSIGINSLETDLLKVHKEYCNAVILMNEPFIDTIRKFSAADITGYGTGRDEVVTSLENLVDVAVRSKEQAPAELNYHFNTMNARVMGNTGVVDGTITMSFDIAGENTSMDARLSVVYEYLDNKWKAVHLHSSFPSSEQALGDAYPLDALKAKNEELQRLVEEKTATLQQKNRELEIETSLERVRAEMMAMQKSEDLRQVIASVFKQLQLLGFDAPACSLIIYTNDLAAEHWMTGFSQDVYPESYTIPYNGHPYFTDLLRAWQNGISFAEFFFEGELKTGYAKWLFEYSDFAKLPQAFKDEVKSPQRTVVSDAFMRYGMLEVISVESLPEEKVEIVKRFAKVFEQTFTRFLDLQKAEAQAREAKIESALERVRARTMAMHKSEELKEVLQLILDQLCGLNFDVDSADFIVDPKENDDFTIWIAAPGQQYASLINLPYLDHPIFNWVVEAKEKGKCFYTFNCSMQEKNTFFDHFFKYALVTEERRKALYSSTGWAQSSLFMKTVALNIRNYSGIPYSEEQNDTLLRFGTVFEQTYIRFLDLQKAEAQAREAKIEAALERVRSRSMGMQKSEELREVIQLILDQLLGLHFNIDSSSFTAEMEIKNNDFKTWIAAPGQQYATLVNLPYLNNPVFNRLLEANRKGETFLSYTMSKEEKDRFIDHFIQYVPGVPEERKQFWYNSAGWATSSVLMKSLSLNIQNYCGIPYSEEENTTLLRFGKAFEQTYTRFLDLQRAEASAKEAVRQASLDRVRAEIASMRTTADLERITPLVWNELTNLGVPFIRCGVFIMDEKEEQIHIYLSSPNGKAIAAFQIPMHTEGDIQNALANWRRNKIYTVHWDAAAFATWTKSLVEHGTIKAEEKYITEKPPENLYLHFLPFLQGMLYVGNSGQISEDDIKLVQSLADAFSTAYARYEDFNKLENAKQQIEQALADLKAAQAQLIQNEKMASLGEVTAGIAHEIQNPLNFVNNFSEVSVELLDELKGGPLRNLAETDKTEADEIVESLTDNLQKINHHGKRADTIVKGMLEHSRASTGKKEATDINALADEYLRLAYHGLRAKDKDFNVELKTDFDESIGKIEVVPQDIGRVLLNLYNNAFYAASLRIAIGTKGGFKEGHQPTVTVTTKRIPPSGGWGALGFDFC